MFDEIKWEVSEGMWVVDDLKTWYLYLNIGLQSSLQAQVQQLCRLRLATLLVCCEKKLLHCQLKSAWIHLSGHERVCIIHNLLSWVLLFVDSLQLLNENTNDSRVSNHVKDVETDA